MACAWLVAGGRPRSGTERPIPVAACCPRRAGPFGARPPTPTPAPTRALAQTSRRASHAEDCRMPQAAASLRRGCGARDARQPRAPASCLNLICCVTRRHSTPAAVIGPYAMRVRRLGVVDSCVGAVERSSRQFAVALAESATSRNHHRDRRERSVPRHALADRHPRPRLHACTLEQAAKGGPSPVLVAEAGRTERVWARAETCAGQPGSPFAATTDHDLRHRIVRL